MQGVRGLRIGSRVSRKKKEGKKKQTEKEFTKNIYIC